MAVQGGEDVYVTLLLSDPYLPGALVLAHSLRDAATAKKLAVMVTLDSVSAEAITQLKTVYDYIIPVPRIRNGSPANLYLMNRPDLHSAFTKINLWKQTQFRKIVYIDADVVAFRAPDELFDIPHAFSAAPDIGWPDLFNSGVMVLTPSMGDYYALMAMADRGISFDGADQGLLNMHFKNTYNRLSFTYNVTPSAHYQYVPAYRHLQSSINMVHFIGSEKPWTRGRDATTGSSPFDEMVGRWWAVYDRHYRRDTPAPTESQAPSQSPELVQYFVKGEYQPRISYTVPTGEPRQSPGDTSSHGQHYEYVPPQSHFAHHGPPGHNEHHHDHHHEGQQPPHHGPAEDHHHHHQHDQHQHDQHQHHSPHSSDQSQPAASVPHPEQSFSTPSASFSSERTQTEARQGQVPEHQHPPPPPSYEPEHRNQPPQPPPMESSWDAQRHPPPADSKPEALHLPQAHYAMSSDVAPFVPPERYPSPPRNMWYEVPKAPPAPQSQRPPPIFPWEGHQPPASRVFGHDEDRSEPPVSELSKTESSGLSRATAEPSMTGDSVTEQLRSEPATPTSLATPVPQSDPWSSFTRTNAWDEVPQIERYVGALQPHRRVRSRGAPAGLRLGGGGLMGNLLDDREDLEGSFRRRGLKVTDFPSAVDRPSLPVTPAPIRRPRLWAGGGPGFGDEGDEDERLLPAAPGVPQQTDWDPVAQLQKLARQQSEALLRRLGGGGSGEQDRGYGPHEIPSRPLPYGSEGAKSPTYVAHAAVLSPRPVKSSTSLQSFLGSEMEDATPRTAATNAPPIEMDEPSYRGPGVAWEKDEEVREQGVSAALPSEEQQDVLET